MGKKEIFLIATVLIQVTIEMPQGYVRGNCQRGEYIFFADKTNLDPECKPCRAGYFMDQEWHDNRECLPCTILTKKYEDFHHLAVVENCTLTSDTKFGCQTGYYLEPNSDPHFEIPTCSKMRYPVAQISSTLLPKQESGLNGFPSSPPEGRHLQNTTSPATAESPEEPKVPAQSQTSVITIVLCTALPTLAIVVLIVCCCCCFKKRLPVNCGMSNMNEADIQLNEMAEAEQLNG